MEKVGVFYGSKTGNTEKVANNLKKLFGEDNVELFDVGKLNINKLKSFKNIIFGTSTWGIGEMQGDFEIFMSEVAKLNLTEKKIAIYGLGDADKYGDTFVDAIGIIYDKIKNKGCDIIGFVSTDDYIFKESMGVIDGKFVGLPIDEDNESDKTDYRIESWVNQLKEEFV